MTKTITVTDEHGANYGTTYMKRARGLVKHGRARFVDETTICLACPPNIKNLEDMKVSENNITISEILSRIDAINNDRFDYTEAFKQITAIAQAAKSPDCAGEIAGTALKESLLARETTKHNTLQFLEKMYNDLVKPQIVNAAAVENRNNELMGLKDLLASIDWDELHDEAKLIMRNSIMQKYGIVD